jgi:hypothetical protein
MQRMQKQGCSFYACTHGLVQLSPTTALDDLAVGCLVELTFEHVCQRILSVLLPCFGSGVGSLQGEEGLPERVGQCVARLQMH